MRRRQTGLLAEHALEGALAHADSVGQRRRAQVAAGVFDNGRHQLAQARCGMGLQLQARAVLRLAARAAHKEHQITRHGQGHGRAAVRLDQGQAEVNPRRHAGRGVEGRRRHKDRLRFHLYGRKHFLHQPTVFPVRGGAPAIEQPRCCQHHGPHADAGHAPGVRGAAG